MDRLEFIVEGFFSFICNKINSQEYESERFTNLIHIKTFMIKSYVLKLLEISY